MSENLDILNWLWSLFAIPLAYLYKLNQRLTKVESVQEIKIDRLKTLENKVDLMREQLSELTGILKEHLRR